MPIINACKIESQPLEIWFLTAHMKKTQKTSFAGFGQRRFSFLGDRLRGGIQIYFFFSFYKSTTHAYV